MIQENLSQNRPSVAAKCKQLLNRALISVHQLLVSKDIDGIFLYPVTETIAPGYSKVIDRPMDYSTMKRKIQQLAYANLKDYYDDFELMCSNALTYNEPDTVYYKAAQKMLAYGQQMFSREKLLLLRREISALRALPLASWGFPWAANEQCIIDVPDPSQGVFEGAVDFDQYSQLSRTVVNSEASATDVLGANKQAAATAAERLRRKRPTNRVGWLEFDESLPARQAKFRFLNPDAVTPAADEVPLSTDEAIVTLGDRVGPIPKTTGTNRLDIGSLDPRYRIRPVTYLDYSHPFTSISSAIDSSNSNMTKEESDLLMRTFGTQDGCIFAESVREFVYGKDATQFYSALVDRLLDTISHGGYSKNKQELEAFRSDRVRLDHQTPPPQPAVSSTDCVQQQLAGNAEKISRLETYQNERLTETGSNLRQVEEPDEEEQALAVGLASDLASTIRTVAPADVVSRTAVHSAINSAV